MPISNRAATRRYAALKATSSLVAVNLMLGAGVLLASAVTPSLALADTPNTNCGATSGVVVCPSTGNNYTGGITINDTVTTGVSVLLQNDNISNKNLGGDGVLVTSNKGQDAGVAFVTVSPNTPPTTVQGNGLGNGIKVTSNGGNVSVNTLDHTGVPFTIPNDLPSTVKGLTGIVVSTTGGAGTVDVTVGGLDKITGTTIAGIQAVNTGTGNSTVTIDAGGSVSGLISGVSVANKTVGPTGGNVTVNLAGNATATVGAGVFVNAGNVATFNSSGNASTPGLAGANINGKSVVFNQTAGTITGAGPGVILTAGVGGANLSSSTGAQITSKNVTGLATISTGNVTGTLNGNVSGDYATTTDVTGAATIDLTYGGNNTGTNGGIEQSTVSGNNSITLTGTALADGGAGGNPALEIKSTSGNVSVTTQAGSQLYAVGGGGIDAKTGAAGNVTVSLAGNVGDTSTGVGKAGLTATADAGNLNLTTGYIHATDDGIDAKSNTGGIDIVANGNITAGTSTSAGKLGISAGVTGGAGNINITLGGNIASYGTGIVATNGGTGDINITTLKGFDIVTQTADGIDGFATGGGSVHVNLLDGAINANASHSSAAPAPAINLSAVGAGNVTVNVQDKVTNFGGDGIVTTTENGVNEVGIGPGDVGGGVPANVYNSGGDGVDASSTGTGDVIVSGFGNVSGNVTTPDSGLNAATGTVSAEGVASGIYTTGGSDIYAHTNNNSGGPGGNITIQTIAGGTLDGNIGAATNGAWAQANGNSTSNITVNIGDSIGGNATFGPVTNDGVLAEITNAANNGNVVVTVGGNATGSDAAVITINAGNVGVSATTVGNGSASATLGSPGHLVNINAGNIAVNVTSVVGDATVIGNNTGTLAVNVGGTGPVINVVSLAGNASVGDAGGPMISTVTNNGSGAGINVSAGAAASVNFAGNITTTGTATGDGIDATSTGNVAGVTVAYGNTSLTNSTITSTGTYGINAHVDNPTSAKNVTVILGDAAGVTTTTINMTNTTIPTVGVEASTVGAGNAWILSNGNVTVDPTQYGMEAKSGAGQAKIDTGLNDTYTVADPGNVSYGQHGGLYAHSGAVADPGATSAVVNVAGNNTITVGSGAAPLDGAFGVGALNYGNGTGGVAVTTGANLSLSVTGDNSVGVLASTNLGATKFDGNVAHTGTGNVSVTLGSGTITVTGDDAVDGTANFDKSYGAYATSGGGNVSVLTNANITVSNSTGNSTGVYAATTGTGKIDVGDPTAGTLIDVTNGDGILAKHSGGGNGTVIVGGGVNGLVAGNITTHGFGNGIEATTDGNGKILVTQGSSSTITTLGTAGQNAGIYAYNTAGNLSAGGGGSDVTVVQDGNISTAAGGGTLNTTTGVLTVGGQGVIAATNGDGKLTVTQAATGNITTAGASDGIDVVNTGFSNGDISITLAGNTTAGAAGVVAVTTSNDAIDIALNGAQVTAKGGNGVDATNISAKDGHVSVVTTGTANITASGIGVHATTNGGGTVGVTTSAGSTITATGNGIDATNTFAGNSGDVTVDNEGTIAGSAIGIHAEVTSAANSADVGVKTGSITSTGDGVFAKAAGGGDVKVTVNTLTNGNATLINAGANGVKADAVQNGTTTVIASGNITAVNSGIVATTVDGLDSVTVNGNATVQSTGNGNGIQAVTSGNGSILVNTTAGTNVQGGTGFFKDSGIYANTGGAGTITVNANGNVGTGSPGLNWGINAVGNGGLVTVNQGNTSTVTDGGIRAVNITANGGDATVNVKGHVNTTAHQGVLAQTNTGIATVNLQGTGNVTTGPGAFETGVDVLTDTGSAVFSGAVGTSITSTGSGVRIRATGSGGTISVIELGTINSTGTSPLTAGISASTVDTDILITTGTKSITGANGILTATGGPANTTITTGTGNITGTTADGIHSTTTGAGSINVTTNGQVTGAVNGVFAHAPTGNITVTNNGNVTGTTGSGVDAATAGAGTIQVNVDGVISGATGIKTAQTGTGDTNIVDTNPAFTVTGTNGDGINSTNGAGTGAINVGTKGVPFQADVTGSQDGIDVSGAGVMNVYTAGNVSGSAGWGITAVSTGAAASVNVGVTGPVSGNATGGVGGGILAKSSAISGNAVNVSTTSTVIGRNAGSMGIQAEDLSAGTGNVSVAATGGSVIGVVDAIKATSTGGEVTVGTSGAPITSTLGDGTTIDAAIRTQTTSGNTTINTAASASMALDGNAAFGIVATNVGTKGVITINNAAQIGSSADGVNSAGIAAIETGANTAGLSITNSGNIFVNNTQGFTVAGLVTPDGNPVPALTYGILGFDAGTGDGSIVNSGVIDPADVGLGLEVGGNAVIANTGNVTGNLAGIFAFSTTGQNATVSSNGNAAFVTGINGTGIGAFSFGGGNGTVTVGTQAAPITSNVSGGTEGIDAEGNHTVIVWASGNVTGNTLGNQSGIDGAGIVAISTPGNTAGFVSVNTGPGPVSGSDGIFASSNGTTAANTVTVNVGGNVTATNGIGVAAFAVGGLDTVNLNSGNVSAHGGDGILASSTGTGGVVVNAASGTTVSTDSASVNAIKAQSSGAAGDVTVTSAAVITTTGANSAGIWAYTLPPNTSGNVKVTNTGNISAQGGNSTGIVTQVAAPGSTGTITVDNEAASISATNNGITAFQGGNGSIAITDAVTASGNISAVNYGISALAGVNAGNVTTNAANTSPITITVGDAAGAFKSTISASGTGTQTAAIRARTAGKGDINVTANKGVTLLAPGNVGYGILAENSGSSGAIAVTSSATIGTNVSAIGSVGIDAQIDSAANNSTVTVTNSGNITMANGSLAGIRATTAGTGLVHVINSGTIDPAAYGIYASGNGSVLVDNTGALVLGNIGIHADSQGNSTFTAQVNVGNATVASVVTGQNGNGIEVFGNTAGANVGVDATRSGALTGSTNGILTQTSGAGTTTINTLNVVAANQALTQGQGGDGIRASTTGNGLMTVTTGPVTGAGAAGNTSSGVNVSSTGGSKINVTTTGNIIGNGVGNAAGTGAAGIIAATSGGNGSVSVAVNAPGALNATSSVTGGNYGIFASSAGAGNTTVTVGGAGANLTPVVATGATSVNGNLGPVGISATGGNGTGGLNNGVSVTTYSNVTAANGRAIVTSSGGNGTININNDTIGLVTNTTVIKGAGDATAAFGGTGNFTHAVIDVTTATGFTTTINNNGIVESVNGPAVASYADLAIKASTGGVVVNNSATGTILGRVWAGNVTAGNPTTINNSGIWHTTGTSTLGAGADTIANNAGGYIGTAAGAAQTTIQLGGGTNTITNAGLIVAGEAPLSGTAAAPAVTRILGTNTFTNNGVIVLGGSGTTNANAASDGRIDSVLFAPGAAFGGTGLIDLDANLWSDTQSAAACSAFSLTAADCLVVGSTSGNNGIRVTDTGAHALGAFNPTGIVIVSGSSSAATFHLDAGSSWFNAGGTNQFGGATNVLDKPGLFFYDLAFNSGDNTERLISVPKVAAFEVASLGSAQNAIWYTTSQVWFDRQADLRNTVDGRPAGGAPGVWLKAVGDWINHKQQASYSDFNKTYIFDISYDQDTAALVGGLDFLNVTDKDRAWVVGFQGGYFDSNVNFRGSPDRYHLTGGQVGVYGTYMSGGLFVDGIFSANFGNVNASLPSLQGTSPPPSGAVTNPVFASADVNSYGVQFEAGYQMPIGGSMGAGSFWEPLATVSYVKSHFGDLAVPGGLQQLGNTDSFRASLGARVGTMVDYQYYKLKFSLTARVWDEFRNKALSTLVVPGGSNFFNSDNLHGVFGDVTGQVNLFSTTSGMSAFLNGGVKFKSNYTEGQVTLGARYQW